MATIKTAISIDKPLFEQLGDLAQELNTSRSRIFALAAMEFIQRHKNLKLLEAINAAYDDFPDEKESSLNAVMRSNHFKMVKDQW
jgi:metal-responsive CopG/Arc/MetJ family transcriptional regulator